MCAILIEVAIARVSGGIEFGAVGEIGAEDSVFAAEVFGFGDCAAGGGAGAGGCFRGLGGGLRREECEGR